MLSRSSKVQAGITFQYLRMPRCCGRSHVLPCPAKVPFPRLLIGAQSASHQAYRSGSSPTMLFSRHTRRRDLLAGFLGVAFALD